MTTVNMEASAKGVQPARILFVGGDPFASQVPIRFLISCGFEVVVANSAEEAWSLVDTGKAHFDVVIIDHDTPWTGGIGSIGLITKLRSDRYFCVIILLAAKTRPPELRSYKTLGVNWILRKPVELWELQESLQVKNDTRKGV